MTVEYLIAGDRAALGALRRDLADTYARWMNRLEVRTGLMNLGILDAEAEGEWLAEAAKQNAEMRPTQANFTIYDRRDGEAVGTSALMNVDYAHGRARFGILLGERRGQGLGTEATRLTLDWAFHVMGLRNVMLEVFPWNEAAIRAYERAGFRHVGRRRDALASGGRRFDEVIMDAIPEDFSGSLIAELRPAEG